MAGATYSAVTRSVYNLSDFCEHNHLWLADMWIFHDWNAGEIIGHVLFRGTLRSNELRQRSRKVLDFQKSFSSENDVL